MLEDGSDDETMTADTLDDEDSELEQADPMKARLVAILEFSLSRMTMLNVTELSICRADVGHGIGQRYEVVYKRGRGRSARRTYEASIQHS